MKTINIWAKFCSLFLVVLLIASCSSPRKIRVYGRGGMVEKQYGKNYDGELSDILPSEDMEDISRRSYQEVLGFGGGFFSSDDDIVRIGVLLPLSGSSKKLGESLKNAALLAQSEVAGDNFVLQFYDTEGTADGAEEAAEDAISHDVRLIVGPVFSSSVEAVKKIARKKKVNVISFTTSPTVLEEGVFSVGLLLKEQIERILTYAYDNKINNFVVIVPDNKTGLSAANAAEEVVSDLGMDATIVKTSFYNPQGNDFTALAKDIVEATEIKPEKPETTKESENKKPKEFNFNGVLIVAEGVKLRSIASMLSYYDIYPDKIKYLGTSLWDDVSISREPSLNKGWFSVVPKQSRDSFIKRYKNMFGEEPQEIASLAYDTVALAGVISKTSKTPDFSEEILTAPSGFAGVDGIFRLLPDGNPERGLEIREVNMYGSNVLDKAPASFEELDAIKEKRKQEALSRQATAEALMAGQQDAEKAEQPENSEDGSNWISTPAQ